MDWKHLYTDAKETVEKLEAENREARETMGEQQRIIEGQQSRLEGLALERERLGVGDAAPAWVVEGMDRALTQAEADRVALQADVVRLDAARNDLVQQYEEASREQEMLRSHLEMLQADNAELRCMVLGGDEAALAETMVSSEPSRELADGPSMDEVKARLAELEAEREAERAHAERHGSTLPAHEEEELGSLMESFDLFLPPMAEPDSPGAVGEDSNALEECGSADDGTGEAAEDTGGALTDRSADVLRAQMARAAASGNADAVREAVVRAMVHASVRAAAERAAAERAVAAEKAALSRAARVALEAAATGASPEEVVSAAKQSALDGGRRSSAAEATRRLRGAAQVDAARRNETVALVRRIALLRSEREGESPEAAEAIAAAAVERLNEALEDGMSVEEAVIIAVSRSVDEAPLVAAAVQRVIEEHGEDASPLAVAAAADAASMMAVSGASASVAVSAGERASIGVVARGETLETVNADARVMAEVCAERAAAAASVDATPPGWSLQAWLTSLNLDEVITSAARKRFDATIEQRHGSVSGMSPSALRELETAFVKHLGEQGTVETVLSLLKESPLLFNLASTIHGAAVELSMAAADIGEKNAAGAPDDSGGAGAGTTGAGAGATSSQASSPEAVAAAGEEAANEAADPAAAAETGRELSADEMNAEFVAKAGMLAFAHEQGIFWGGVGKLIGESSAMKLGLLAGMEYEHCSRVDADVPFEARNYGTITTSRIEWYFVARQNELDALDAPLEALGHEKGAWPQGTRGEATVRTTMMYDDFKKSPLGKRLDAELGVEGEQPLSVPEFVALRAYTGPLFEKYNAILRAAIAPFFRSVLENLGCTSSRYELTIQVLAAAIVKLGKLTYVPVVYRAPGRALAPEFWQHARDGLAGIIETGCLSTSANKEVALEYARRSDAKLLFEIRLGFVARGADIGKWGLSQYPSEGEILLPPLTALQMVESLVEKDLLIVAFRPTIMGATIKTGDDDCARLALAEKESERAASAANEEAERAKKEAASDEAARQWKASMYENRLRAARCQASGLKAKFAAGKMREVGEKLKAATAAAKESPGSADAVKLQEEIRRLEAALVDAQRESGTTERDAKRRRDEAARAAEVEMIASRQLRWTLINSNSRLARTRQQEIVSSERKEANALVSPLGGDGGGGAAEDGASSPMANGGGSSEAPLLFALEDMIELVTNPRRRKEALAQAPASETVAVDAPASAAAQGDGGDQGAGGAEGEQGTQAASVAITWEGLLTNCLAKAVECMRSAPGSMQVQSLGCCALACIVGELTDDPADEMSARLRAAALDAGCVDAVKTAFHVLPKVTQQAGEQVIHKLQMGISSKAAAAPAADAAGPAAAQPPKRKRSSTATKAAPPPPPPVSVEAEEENPPFDTGEDPDDVLEEFQEFDMQRLFEQLKKQGIKSLDFFKRTDKDGSGEITKKEFGKAIRTLGFEQVPKADIDAVFDELDPDHSGKIVFEEMDKGLKSVARKIAQANEEKAKLKRQASKGSSASGSFKGGGKGTPTPGGRGEKGGPTTKQGEGKQGSTSSTPRDGPPPSGKGQKEKRFS